MKSAGICTITHPAIQGLRIAHVARMDNAEAYAV